MVHLLYYQYPLQNKDKLNVKIGGAWWAGKWNLRSKIDRSPAILSELIVHQLFLPMILYWMKKIKTVG